MTLVDTSIWVEVFKKQSSLKLEKIISLDEIVTCLPIIQEVLQGFRDEKAFRIAYHSMLSFPCVDIPLSLEICENAISLYRTAKSKGITIRSSVDCLIAASAIKHNLIVIHKDRDFSMLAKISNLQQKSID